MIIAIIPARGGSKRIPKKNIKSCAGKPIIAYSIMAAKNSNIFDRIIVSTDCKEIAMVANEFPEGYVMVMHGRSNTEYNNSLMSLIKTGKLFISTKLVDPDYISEIISSAHIGLSFYRTDDPNSALSGLSSHKLAHYTQCGLPVISNNYPSIRRLIDETKYGICVNSIKEIPHAVHAIDTNYDQYNQNSYKAYSKYYNIDNYMENILASIINSIN